MRLFEHPNPLPGDISVCFASFCEAFVLAVREFIRAEFFDDTRETLHPRLDDDADLWVAHQMRLRILLQSPPGKRSMMRGLWCCIIVASLVLAGPTTAQDFAVLRGLDKVTARISTIDAPIDEVVRFGTLSIVVRRCNKTPPEEPPETMAFLEIDDVKPDERPVRLFSGWMFASSPALSALEHPVYDVWVIGCNKRSTSEGSSSRWNVAVRSSASASR